MKPNSRWPLLLALLASLATATCAAPLTAGKARRLKPTSPTTNLRAVVWQDRGAVTSLNLLYGAGGRAHAPNPGETFTFSKEDPAATSPKFDIVDARGVEWKVKLGEESQSEVAASRFLWAAGYFVDEDYYVAELKVAGMPHLKRGSEFVTSDGVIHGARLERKLPAVEKRGTWDWFDNPLVNRRPMNGLRIMMALVNNWDLKDVNNQVYEVGGQRRYVVTDLGATFGNTGNSLTRSKSAPQEYADSDFVDKTRPASVDLVMHTRPFFLAVLDVPHYEARTRMEGITRRIPRADARWLGRRLARLTTRQIEDGFRAAGYSAADVDVYTAAIKKRIGELSTL